MATTDVCTTQKAAGILGISVTLVQQLVEAGAIEAWKTLGGHRRIPMAAVLAYKESQAAVPKIPGTTVSTHKVCASHTGDGGTVSILIVEDNKMQREIYDRQMSSWNLPMQLTFCENGYQALIEIATHKPDVLLADIVMEGIDGYEIIKTVLTYPDLSDTNIAILSSLSLDELAARGGISPGVVFFRKPINYDELRGYLRACIAQKVRNYREITAG